MGVAGGGRRAIAVVAIWCYLVVLVRHVFSAFMIGCPAASTREHRRHCAWRKSLCRRGVEQHNSCCRPLDANMELEAPTAQQRSEARPTVAASRAIAMKLDTKGWDVQEKGEPSSGFVPCVRHQLTCEQRAHDRHTCLLDV